MEGKGVKYLMVCVLLLGLVLLGQIQVEARSCCPSDRARMQHNLCRLQGGSSDSCARFLGCKIIDGSTCEPPYDHLTLNPQDFEESDALNFCKLGCTSSVCSNINTSIVGTEEGNKHNGAVDRCCNACYRFCTKRAAVVA